MKAWLWFKLQGLGYSYLKPWSFRVAGCVRTLSS